MGSVGKKSSGLGGFLWILPPSALLLCREYFRLLPALVTSKWTALALWTLCCSQHQTQSYSHLPVVKKSLPTAVSTSHSSLVLRLSPHIPLESKRELVHPPVHLSPCTGAVTLLLLDVVMWGPLDLLYYGVLPCFSCIAHASP